jgi:hypothetical protein
MTGRFGIPSSIATDLYRDRTAASPAPIALVRKRCACGKVVTSKQLQQYGACDSCARAAASSTKEAA